MNKQIDPFPGYRSIPSTMHPYNYCSNNPVNYVDPLGMDYICKGTEVTDKRWYPDFPPFFPREFEQDVLIVTEAEIFEEGGTDTNWWIEMRSKRIGVWERIRQARAKYGDISHTAPAEKPITISNPNEEDRLFHQFMQSLYPADVTKTYTQSPEYLIPPTLLPESLQIPWGIQPQGDKDLILTPTQRQIDSLLHQPKFHSSAYFGYAVFSFVPYLIEQGIVFIGVSSYFSPVGGITAPISAWGISKKCAEKATY